MFLPDGWLKWKHSSGTKSKKDNAPRCKCGRPSVVYTSKTRETQTEHSSDATISRRSCRIVIFSNGLMILVMIQWNWKIRG
ncbi:hypothetical protein K1719_043160 [Acacia pycnantha]|nr:hypothetical protein K1719_043160 [Acacia pycnantha]